MGVVVYHRLMPGLLNEDAMEPVTLSGERTDAVADQPVRVTKGYPVPGYLPGLSQPCVVVELALASQVSRKALEDLDRLMAGSLPVASLSASLHPSVQAHGLLRRLVAGTLAILEHGGMPVVAQPMLVGRTAGDDATVHLALPSYGADQATLDALAWVATLMNLALGGRPVDGSLAALPQLLKQISAQAPKGINTRPFLHAAHEAGIPVRHLWRNVFQFGWGSRSRVLDSSLTDETSAIASQLAKSKRAAARVMREAGIPVPRHEVARSPDHAVTIAAELGYPVVVKPGDQDGGRGVAAGLKSDAAVRKAFAVARALSREVLVEKHVEGNDYRVHVYKGEAFWVSYRVPGSVTGDGSSTVAQLLVTTNADPRRGERGSKAWLKRIDLDEEANDLLIEQGLTAQSIPPAGLFVRLRRAANVSSGGVSVPVLHEAHPDNLALAIRAARVLRLDLAGVDLLMPHISRSWLETGAAICEINAQPQYIRGVHACVLQRLVAKDGRIPVVVVLGDQDRDFYQRLADGLTQFGCPGTATSDEVRIGSEIVGRGPFSAYQAGLALLGDTAVDVAVIGISDTAVLNTGMPVDSFDLLVLAGPMNNYNGAADWQRWHRFAAMLGSMSRAGVIVNQDCAQWTADRASFDLKQLVATPYDNLPEAVCRALVESRS